MNKIALHLLWLGHAGDCRDTAKVLDTGIRAVVQLAIEEPPVQFPREIVFVRVPLHDGSENPTTDLQLAVNTVQFLLASGIPTLLCCSAGMSRSPAIAACALAMNNHKSLSEGLAEIQTRVGTDISPMLWRDLLASFGSKSSND
jgi:hypothetical protein